MKKRKRTTTYVGDSEGDGKMTLDEVKKTVSDMLSRRTNEMTKIQCKCWLYHSTSRTKNGNEPFKFDNYIHGLGKDFYFDYIRFNLIDCDDLGGKEKAMAVVEKWFS